MAARNRKKDGNKNVPATRGKMAPAKTMDALIAQDAQRSSGFENMSADDLAIPFIGILQALSPQLRGATKVKGAEEGDFYNNVTQEIFKADIKVVPCAYQKCWVEWQPRESGGGFVRQHFTDEILSKTTRNDRNQDVLPNGNLVVMTAYHFCLLIKESGEVERVVLSFTSTQLKKSRRWNTQMMNRRIEVNGRQITPPMYSHIYTCETEEESNDQGSWCGWVIHEPTLIKDPELYVQARKFHEDCTEGAIKTAPPEGTETHGTMTTHGIDDDDEAF